IHDHPALHVALDAGPAVGLVVLDDCILEAASARRRAHFYANVRALREAYATRGGTLVVRRGDPAAAVPAVAHELSAAAVHALRSYTPYGGVRDAATARALGVVPLHWHGGLYIHEPGTVR